MRINLLCLTSPTRKTGWRNDAGRHGDAGQYDQKADVGLVFVPGRRLPIDDQCFRAHGGDVEEGPGRRKHPVPLVSDEGSAS